MKHKIVEITWEDIASHQGWSPLSEHLAAGTALCFSVGYLIRKDKKQVTILQSVCQDGDVTESLCIPRAVIQRIRILQ
jgi:hypothetical protein